MSQSAARECCPAISTLLTKHCSAAFVAAAQPLCDTGHEAVPRCCTHSLPCMFCCCCVLVLSMVLGVISAGSTQWSLAAVFCLQSFDLQRVLEGEKALRSEATRQLKEVEKKLVSLRSPAVALSSPMPAPLGSERTLEADKAMLQDQIKAHSAQVWFIYISYARIGSTHLSVVYLISKPSTCHGLKWSPA